MRPRLAPLRRRRPPGTRRAPARSPVEAARSPWMRCRSARLKRSPVSSLRAIASAASQAARPGSTGPRRSAWRLSRWARNWQALGPVRARPRSSSSRPSACPCSLVAQPWRPSAHPCQARVAVSRSGRASTSVVEATTRAGSPASCQTNALVTRPRLRAWGSPLASAIAVAAARWSRASSRGRAARSSGPAGLASRWRRWPRDGSARPARPAGARPCPAVGPSRGPARPSRPASLPRAGRRCGAARARPARRRADGPPPRRPRHPGSRPWPGDGPRAASS